MEKREREALTCLNCSSKLQFCCEEKLFCTGLPPPFPIDEGVGGCEGGRMEAEGEDEDVDTGGNERPEGGTGIWTENYRCVKQVDLL
jgi:hypothetical protein